MEFNINDELHFEIFCNISGRFEVLQHESEVVASRIENEGFYRVCRDVTSDFIESFNEAKLKEYESKNENGLFIYISDYIDTIFDLKEDSTEESTIIMKSATGFDTVYQDSFDMLFSLDGVDLLLPVTISFYWSNVEMISFDFTKLNKDVSTDGIMQKIAHKAIEYICDKENNFKVPDYFDSLKEKVKSNSLDIQIID